MRQINRELHELPYKNGKILKSGTIDSPLDGPDMIVPICR